MEKKFSISRSVLYHLGLIYCILLLVNSSALGQSKDNKTAKIDSVKKDEIVDPITEFSFIIDRPDCNKLKRIEGINGFAVVETKIDTNSNLLDVGVVKLKVYDSIDKRLIIDTMPECDAWDKIIHKNPAIEKYLDWVHNYCNQMSFTKTSENDLKAPTKIMFLIRFNCDYRIR